MGREKQSNGIVKDLRVFWSLSYVELGKYVITNYFKIIIIKPFVVVNLLEGISRTLNCEK